MMDDLISRKALYDDLCQDREEGTFDFTEKQAEAADKIIRYINDRIEAQPSVPAVSLAPLCEWLADKAYMYLSEEEMDNGWSSHDPAYWEMKLSKWMEEQNAR